MHCLWKAALLKRYTAWTKIKWCSNAVFVHNYKQLWQILMNFCMNTQSCSCLQCKRKVDCSFCIFVQYVNMNIWQAKNVWVHLLGVKFLIDMKSVEPTLFGVNPFYEHIMHMQRSCGVLVSRYPRFDQWLSGNGRTLQRLTILSVFLTEHLLSCIQCQFSHKLLWFWVTKGMIFSSKCTIKLVFKPTKNCWILL